MTSEPGSFARYTIVERKPQIIHQVINDNTYQPDIVAALLAFKDEIANRPIHPLHESAQDTEFWNTALSAYAGKTWLEVPWYFAETYFYRKLLEAVRYFQPGAWQGRDPFREQKRKQMEADIRRLAPAWEQFSTQEPGALFKWLLHSSLWGNRTDLSHFSNQVDVDTSLDASRHRHLILINHTAQLYAYLSAGVRQVDFINDNAGSELFFDLALADFILQKGWASQVHMHLKNQPFFVSDAMPDDFHRSITLLKAAPAAKTRELGSRLDYAQATGRLITSSDPFLTTCLMYRQMPAELQRQLAQADLVLFKGDVNYRRLLDDAHWPFTTRLEDVTSYFPAPFAALRTLKGEIMVGLGPRQAEAIAAEDPQWLINGKRGVIHFVQRAG
jgi:uncharacterized protein with ATP-grasp and redox domains